jgi:hypothetical protein
MSNFKFELGAKVKDIVSGFEGIVTGRCDYLTGCNNYGVNPQQVKDGKPMGAVWLDENKLEKIGDGLIGKVSPVDINGNTGADDTNPDGSKFERC